MNKLLSMIVGACLALALGISNANAQYFCPDPTTNLINTYSELNGPQADRATTVGPTLPLPLYGGFAISQACNEHYDINGFLNQCPTSIVGGSGWGAAVGNTAVLVSASHVMTHGNNLGEHIVEPAVDLRSSPYAPYFTAPPNGIGYQMETQYCIAVYPDYQDCDSLFPDYLELGTESKATVFMTDKTYMTDDAAFSVIPGPLGTAVDTTHLFNIGQISINPYQTKMRTALVYNGGFHCVVHGRVKQVSTKQCFNKNGTSCYKTLIEAKMSGGTFVPGTIGYGGDSGSEVVTNTKGHNSVGLMVGGSNKPDQFGDYDIFMIPIGNVISDLGLTNFGTASAGTAEVTADDWETYQVENTDYPALKKAITDLEYWMGNNSCIIGTRGCICNSPWSYNYNLTANPLICGGVIKEFQPGELVGSDNDGGPTLYVDATNSSMVTQLQKFLPATIDGYPITIEVPDIDIDGAVLY